MDANTDPLPRPRTAAGRTGLDTLLASPADALVALDFDGTLAPIVDDPSESRLVDGALPALRRVAAAVGHVAVVTGRQAEVAVRLGGLDTVPGLVVEGLYGAERWADGRLHTTEPPPAVDAARGELPRIVTEPGVWVEDKVLSLVVHTRPAADPDAALAALQAPLRAVADRHGLEVHPGRYVLELRLPGIDKGLTLRRLVETFGPGALMFAGDDLGDLPAFAAVEDLRADGGPAGLTVCSGGELAVPEVADRADVVVDGPAGVARLLDTLAAHAR